MERRLKGFETAGLEKFHSEELHIFYVSEYVEWMMISNRTR
jgi:hypothetical protein